MGDRGNRKANSAGENGDGQEAGELEHVRRVPANDRLAERDGAQQEQEPDIKAHSMGEARVVGSHIQ